MPGLETAGEEDLWALIANMLSSLREGAQINRRGDGPTSLAWPVTKVIHELVAT